MIGRGDASGSSAGSSTQDRGFPSLAAPAPGAGVTFGPNSGLSCVRGSGCGGGDTAPSGRRAAPAPAGSPGRAVHGERGERGSAGTDALVLGPPRGVSSVASDLHISSFSGLIGQKIAGIISKLVIGGEAGNSLTFFTGILSSNLFNYQMISLKYS